MWKHLCEIKTYNYLNQKGKAFWHSKDIVEFSQVKTGLSNYQETSINGLKGFIFGDKSEELKPTFALIGDSHALAIAPAIEKIALDKKQKVIRFYDKCFIFSNEISYSKTKHSEGCIKRAKNIHQYLKENNQIKTIFIALRWHNRNKLLWDEFYSKCIR